MPRRRSARTSRPSFAPFSNRGVQLTVDHRQHPSHHPAGLHSADVLKLHQLPRQRRGDPQQPPDADTRTVLEDRLDDRAAHAEIGGKSYVVQHVLGLVVALEQRTLAAGFEMTPRNWAKIGELVLHNGSPVVSASSVAQCWRGSSANRAYSLGWWNNRAAPGGREFDFEAMLNRKWPAQEWSGAAR